MSKETPIPTMIELPTGAITTAMCRVTTDWASVRMMVESGVPVAEAAELFKVTERAVHLQAKKEQWLTPSRVDKLRKKLASMQREVYDRTGMTKDLVSLKASMWEERSERWKERMADIVEQSLDSTSAVTIEEAKDLKTVMDIARTLTGEAKTEENAPKMAVNIAFLRSGSAPRPVDHTDIEVESV